MARRPGRRPGNPNTRDAILTTARELFADRGYNNVSVRQIAARANVDAALVYHYFDTKEQLFLAAVQAPIDPAVLITQILDGDPEEIPGRLVRIFLSVWEDPITGQAMRSLLRRAASDQQTALLVKDFFATQVVGRVLPTVEGLVDPPELPIRASLVASQLFGVALVRYVLQFDPLSIATTESVAAAITPTIARYLLDDDLPLPS